MNADTRISQPVSELSYPKIERDIRYNCEEANRETDLSRGKGEGGGKKRSLGEKRGSISGSGRHTHTVVSRLRRKSLNKEMIAGASAPFVAGVSKHGS